MKVYGLTTNLPTVVYYFFVLLLSMSTLPYFFLNMLQFKHLICFLFYRNRYGFITSCFDVDFTQCPTMLELKVCKHVFIMCSYFSVENLLYSIYGCDVGSCLYLCQYVFPSCLYPKILSAQSSSSFEAISETM